MIIIKSEQIKISESYTALLGQKISKLFPSVRFSMYHGSGSSFFVEADDKEIYEIRVEPAKYASDYFGKNGPQLNSLKVLSKIENSNIFDKTRQVGGGRPSFVGTYQPDFGTYQTPSRLEYLITVVHWKNSQYKSYVEEQLLPKRKEINV